MAEGAGPDVLSVVVAVCPSVVFEDVVVVAFGVDVGFGGGSASGPGDVVV